MNKYKYIFPLGSSCFINSRLVNSTLAKYKIYYSFFNGMRLISNHIMPVKLFFEQFDQFCNEYCNDKNWIIYRDEYYNDINAINIKLNIRRCHLKYKNTYFIEQCQKNINFIKSNFNEILFILDLNDYMCFDSNQIYELCNICKKYNVFCFIREKRVSANINQILNMLPIISSSISAIPNIINNYNITNNIQIIKNELVNLINILSEEDYHTIYNYCNNINDLFNLAKKNQNQQYIYIYNLCKPHIILADNVKLIKNNENTIIQYSK